MRQAAVWATVLLLSACGAGHTSTAAVTSPTATTSPVPSASPTATTSACDASHPCLALVTLRGSDNVVVRDITDVAHPKTLGYLGSYPAMVGIGAPLAQFASSNQIAFVTGKADDYYGLPTSLMRVPIAGAPQTSVISGHSAVVAFAWSPDGHTLIYLTPTDFTDVKLHQLRGGVDRVLATLPPIAVGGCEMSPCPGPFQNPGDKWDFRLLFSPDGSHISVVENGIDSYFRVWTSDGPLVTSSDAPAQTMSIWSGESLYFRDSKGVEVWHDGVVSTFLPGVAWIRPKASPAGTKIVYAARDATGSAHVFVVDTVSGKVTDLGKGRSEPAFLTDRYVWYQAEPACVAAHTCDPGFPGIASGKTYIYDLVGGIESSSIITSVLDVWPHAA